jgi:hypothetical protein
VLVGGGTGVDVDGGCVGPTSTVGDGVDMGVTVGVVVAVAVGNAVGTMVAVGAIAVEVGTAVVSTGVGLGVGLGTVTRVGTTVFGDVVVGFADAGDGVGVVREVVGSGETSTVGGGSSLVASTSKTVGTRVEVGSGTLVADPFS